VRSALAEVDETDDASRRSHPSERRDLFIDLAPAPRRRRRSAALSFSLLLHAVAVGVLLLAPLLLPETPPSGRQPLIAFIYDPPPPPPPPLPLGSGLTRARTLQPARPASAELEPRPDEPRLVAPVAEPSPSETSLHEPGIDAEAGSPTGSPFGVPEGMEEGVEGGVVGGVPGGVLGGVIGGTGTGPIPVTDYDRPPRLLRMRKPPYPDEAFVKKVEGTVVVEILIDDTGRVVRARIVSSVPLLDAAALGCVKEWVFAPAIKKGRPVATVALAPVSFRIY
jgi:protein TonB